MKDPARSLDVPAAGPSAPDLSTGASGTAVDPVVPVWLALLVIGAFLAALRSPIDHTASDPKGSLLTAQAILYTGSARLDDYATEENSWIDPSQADRFVVRREHIYYRHPMGPSLLAIPFVWMANLHGKDLHKPTTDSDLQNLLSAVMVAGSVLLSYSLSRRFVSPRLGLLLTAGFVFGGSYISTMGTAYWNSGAASLLGLGALTLLADLGLGRRVSFGLLAVLLVLALSSRPTLLVLVGLSLPYVWYVRRNAFPRFAGILVAVVGVFAVLQYHLYDGFNLDYYRPSRLARPFAFLLAVVCVTGLVGWLVSSRLVPLVARHVGSPSNRFLRSLPCALAAIVASACLIICVAWLPGAVNRGGLTHSSVLPNQREVVDTVRAVYGVLLSPGRGLLVYSPYLLLTLYAVCAGWRSLRRNPLFILVSAWFVIHTFIIARPGRWHGGHCFGSRMYLDAFGAVMVMTLLSFQAVRPARLVRVLLVFAVVCAVFFNTYQGSFNRWTILWNRDPNVDAYPRYLLNWRYPAFLACPVQIEARMAEHERWMLTQASKVRPDVKGPRQPTPGQSRTTP